MRLMDETELCPSVGKSLDFYRRIGQAKACSGMPNENKKKKKINDLNSSLATRCLLKIAEIPS